MTQTASPIWQLDLERSFDAPVHLVFEAWTTPELWARWFPPRGFEMTIHQMSFKEGGAFAAQFDGHGMTSAFSGEYTEIVPNQKLAWSAEFPDGPKGQMLTTVVFVPDGDKTTLKVNQSFFVMSPIAEQGIKGAREGWGQTLDKLGEFLAARQAG